MDPDETMCQKQWTKLSSSSVIDGFKNLSDDNQSFSTFVFPQRKWDASSSLEYRARIEDQFSEFSCESENVPSVDCISNNLNSVQCAEDDTIRDAPNVNKVQEWDPRGVLTNLMFLEQKVQQLRDLVHVVIGRSNQVGCLPNELLVQQQHLITADLTSIIVQLISTAGSLLPSAKPNLCSVSLPVNQGGMQFGGPTEPFASKLDGGGVQPQNTVNKGEEQSNDIDHLGNCRAEHVSTAEEHESKDEDDADEGENLPPGSYEILQLEKEEILAPHTHFCTICGKGFKRDANLRMHMRGHGDEYKTLAALAKPMKESSSEHTLIKRYSCPYVGCKRNKYHKKFQPLKTILCVKNHYKRTHCDKSFICSRCHTKKFSVIADLKTHEKHCGRDKWLCSCGTTFSRKDKLFGHIALFQGHTPAIPIDEPKASADSADGGQSNEAGNKVERLDFSVQSNIPGGGASQDALDGKESGAGDPGGYFSPLNFDPTSLNGCNEFPRPPFEDSDASFCCLLSGSSDYSRKTGRYANSSSME